MTRSLLLTSLLLLCGLPALAQEIQVLGSHPLEGARGGQAFQGQLTIHPDATFELERRYASGARERERGTALVDGRELVLERQVGLSGTVAGGSGLRRAYRHEVDGKQVWWRTQAGNDWERFATNATENKAKLVWRMLRAGRPFRWVFAHNRGVVDPGPTPDLRIVRSRQPKPKDLRRFLADGGKTVLSLNGDQDEDVKDTLWKPLFKASWAPKVPRRVKVNLRRYIRDLGLEHYHVSMSAGRAPSEQELTEVFRVLLDDTKKPILLHCHGGSDRTGVIGALYAIEFLHQPKAQAKDTMRAHLWAASGGTEIQGAFVDLYQPGSLRALLQRANVGIPARFP
ncbi:MAG: tyrosine-protein phosphatase [Planctomycetota bacterium]